MLSGFLFAFRAITTLSRLRLPVGFDWLLESGEQPVHRVSRDTDRKDRMVFE